MPATRLMFAGLALVTLGCGLRVSREVIAYQGYRPGAWSVLLIFALCELAGLTRFSINIPRTSIFEPS